MERKEKYFGLLNSQGISYFIFIFFGVICLTCWNIVLASMDLYTIEFYDYSPIFVFPLLNFFLNFLCQIILVVYDLKISYFSRIVTSLIICIVTMSLLPFVLLNIKDFYGFILCCILITFQGFANAIFQNSVFALGGFLPFNFIVAISYGVGSAGILVNIIRFGIIFLFGIENQEEKEVIRSSAYIFYGYTVLVLLFALVLLIILFRNKWFIHTLGKSGNKTEFSKEKYKEIEKLFIDDIEFAIIKEVNKEYDNLKVPLNQEISQSFNHSHKYKTKSEALKALFNQIYNFVILICCHHMVHFTAYPGLLFELNIL